MAKVVGPLHSTFASGKFGDIIYSRNQHGMYAKQNGFVVDNPTADQLLMRDALTQCQNNWKNESVITPELKDMWHSFSRNYPISTKLGKQVYGSGRDWYIRVNFFRVLGGYYQLPRPPKIPSCLYYPKITFTQDINGVWMTSDPPPTGEEMIYLTHVPWQTLQRRSMPKNTHLLALQKSTDNNPLLVIPNASLDPTKYRFFFCYRSISYTGIPSSKEIQYHDYQRL